MLFQNFESSAQLGSYKDKGKVFLGKMETLSPHSECLAFKILKQHLVFLSGSNKV